MTESLYLLADIGATNARFAQADEDGIGPATVWPTRQFRDAGALFSQVNEQFGQADYRCVVIAAAGPLEVASDGSAGSITDAKIEITNTGLELSQNQAQLAFSAPVELTNDFQATAYGVPHTAALTQIGGELETSMTHHAAKAVLGPGTGLGMAGLVHFHSGWHVVASEGGHADLAPGNPLEAQLLEYMSQTLGHVSWESALSGPGLVNLYQAMCGIWGTKASFDDPAQIVANGQDMSDLICHQTLESFAGLLGSAAGNLALMYLARGGVYLAGGLTQKLHEFLPSSPLRRRFEERGRMQEMVRSIPIYLVDQPEPGLFGAWQIACARSA